MSWMDVQHKKGVSVTLNPALFQQTHDTDINLRAVHTATLKQEISAA